MIILTCCYNNDLLYHKVGTWKYCEIYHLPYFLVEDRVLYKVLSTDPSLILGRGSLY
jgi:predicted membrane-bound mannosyltransferase